jgi:glycosyltransferase involved in cell wall biosynthesis
MKRRHIVHVSSYYPPHLGGQENAVASLARQLAQSGYVVDVITSTMGGGPRGISVGHGMRITRLGGVVFGHAPILPWFPVALFQATKPDSIVHVHIGQAFTPEMVWLVSALRRFKYVAQLHIDFAPSGPAGVLLPMYKRHILKRVLQAADAIVVLNEKTLQTVRTEYGFTGKAYIMNNGIDEAFFALQRSPLLPEPPQTLRLLFVGRLTPQKNVAALLSALHRTEQQVSLHIIGEGPEGKTLRRLADSLGLLNVTFHGRLTREAVMRFYQTCDALIMPSLYEAQPLVLLEAMAAGIPIIGTNVIGVQEHLEGVGIIVEPTPAGLAEGISQFYSQYDTLPARLKAGARRANTMRWPQTLRQYKDLYDTVSAT